MFLGIALAFDWNETNGGNFMRASSVYKQTEEAEVLKPEDKIPTKTDEYAGIRQQVKVYLTVFVSLLLLTLLTVSVSAFHFDETRTAIVTIAIAVIKLSLIAAFFMHLIFEKSFLFKLLSLPVFLLIALLVLSIFTQLGTTAEILQFGGAEHF